MGIGALPEQHSNISDIAAVRTQSVLLNITGMYKTETDRESQDIQCKFNTTTFIHIELEWFVICSWIMSVRWWWWWCHRRPVTGWISGS